MCTCACRYVVLLNMLACYYYVIIIIVVVVIIIVGCYCYYCCCCLFRLLKDDVHCEFCIGDYSPLSDIIEQIDLQKVETCTNLVYTVKPL